MVFGPRSIAVVLLHPARSTSARRNANCDFGVIVLFNLDRSSRSIFEADETRQLHRGDRRDRARLRSERALLRRRRTRALHRRRASSAHLALERRGRLAHLRRARSRIWIVAPRTDRTLE